MEHTISTSACLSFRVGAEIFATSVVNAHEILALSKITAIPHAPVFMRGVTNLRGTVLPVIDTRIKFGLPQGEETEDTCIIVLNLSLHGNTVMVGALVDAVIEVFDVPEAEIKPLPAMGSRYNNNFIKGTIKVGDNFVLFLDIEKVFTSDELIQVAKSDNT